MFYHVVVETIYLDPSPPNLWRELARWAALGYLVQLAPVPASLGVYVKLAILQRDASGKSQVVYARQFAVAADDADVARQLLWARALIGTDGARSDDHGLGNASNGAMPHST